MPLIPKLSFRSDEQKRADAYNEVLRFEAKVGGQLFGTLPKGHRREFFCLDRHTWVWHEEWIDKTGARQVATTRYHIRPDGILKTQGNQGYQQLTRSELNNLYHAAKLYNERLPAAVDQRFATA